MSLLSVCLQIKLIILSVCDNAIKFILRFIQPGVWYIVELRYAVVSSFHFSHLFEVHRESCSKSHVVHKTKLQHTRGYEKGKEKMVTNFPHEHLCLRQNMAIYLHYTSHKRKITCINPTPNVAHMRYFGCLECEFLNWESFC